MVSAASLGGRAFTDKLEPTHPLCFWANSVSLGGRGVTRNSDWSPPSPPADASRTAADVPVGVRLGGLFNRVWAGHRSVATVFDRYGHLSPGGEDPVMGPLDATASPPPR